MATKIDVKKTFDGYRARRGAFQLLDLPDRQYLMIDGHGDPNTSGGFAAAIETIFPVAYTLKFASKQQLGRDYVVPPLEGLWWADDLASFTARRNKSEWDWTLLNLIPDWIDDELISAAVERAGAKGNPPRLADLRRQTLSEGRCAQTLHLGSFDDEAAVLAELHEEFLPANGLRPTGKHHEIYLSDFRRVAPEKLRTIIRQPVAEA